MFQFFPPPPFSAYRGSEYNQPCFSHYWDVSFFNPNFDLVNIPVTNFAMLYHHLTVCAPSDPLLLTLSLPQPVKFRPERCRDVPANSIFSDFLTHLLLMLCVSIKILSHASAKKETKRLKWFKFRAVIGRFQVTPWQ